MKRNLRLATTPVEHAVRDCLMQIPNSMRAAAGLLFGNQATLTQSDY
jgi:hypothetical protein